MLGSDKNGKKKVLEMFYTSETKRLSVGRRRQNEDADDKSKMRRIENFLQGCEADRMRNRK
jgi:hypothetical protein